MNLSIKALLPEVEKPEETEEKPAKGKKRKAKVEEEVDADELREWKDDSTGDGGVSIAEMLVGVYVVGRSFAKK